ncbi:hypothetical protein BZA77DRAFT_362081 [Pyronema omphalodes]|nr:hypothetical protein BZA77DRAFT_362081 [Pyronema omphalodes]
MQTTIFALLPLLLAVSALPAAPSTDIPRVHAPVSSHSASSSSDTMPNSEVMLAFMSNPFPLLTTQQIQRLNEVNGASRSSRVQDSRISNIPDCPACSTFSASDVRRASSELQKMAHWTDRFCAQRDVNDRVVDERCKGWKETTMKQGENTVFRWSGCPGFAWFC